MNKPGSIAMQAILSVITAASMLVSASCISDPAPEIPDFPGETDATISFESIGSPSMCKCMIDYDLALVAAGSNLVVVDIVNGEKESVIDIGLEIDDIADSDVNGFGYLLVDSLLYPVNLSAAALEDPIDIGIGCSYVSVSSETDNAWVAMDNDSIGMIDLVTFKVAVVQGISISNCQGIASADNGALYIADGSNSVIIGYQTDTWAEIGRVSVPGEVYDLFPGASGYICAIVDGSNELWYIRTEDCSLYKMITFPVIPTAAASMPDCSYAYATCPGIGMIVVAESGQTELKTTEYGLPSSIDVTSNGERAIVCSSDNEAVYILVN